MLRALIRQFAKTNSEELGVQVVPSLNLVYTEEEGYVTADIAESKSLVSFVSKNKKSRCLAP